MIKRTFYTGFKYNISSGLNDRSDNHPMRCVLSYHRYVTDEENEP